MIAVTTGPGPAAWTATSGDGAMTNGVESGPVLYAVRAGWAMAHVMRFAEEVALCGRPMPDRFVTLRSSTSPAGTELCAECQRMGQRWSGPDR